MSILCISYQAKLFLGGVLLFIRLHRFLPWTKVEGPGNRACLWVQGCSIRCKGCAVPETWDANCGEEISVSEIAERILRGPSIEGITFVGGEPFDQAEALAELGGILKKEGLSIITFTGYTYEDIQNSSRKGFRELLSVTDILIDGPYIQECSDLSRPWVGSTNQRYHFITSRYKHLDLLSITNKVEVRISDEGTILINGMGDFELIKKVFCHL